MKKLCTAGLLAIALMAASQQQASAWINARIGLGLDLQFSAGDNCFLFGMWHNGPTPPADPFHYGVFPHGVYPHHHHQPAPAYYPPAAAYIPYTVHWTYDMPGFHPRPTYNYYPPQPVYYPGW